jgi:hypothetical protein
MTLVREIADVIRMIAEVVKNTREIVETINDGRKFLAANHPDAKGDFVDLLDEMQRTVEGLAEVTKVISGFRFVYDEHMFERNTAERELARFNTYVIDQRKDVTALRNRIRKLKADCEKVRTLRDKLDARTQDRSWGSLFGLLGNRARQRAGELASSLSNFYADDQRMIDLFQETLRLAEMAIDDVDEALGPRGRASPYNVPTAAEVLGTYATLFERPERELHALADGLSQAATALRA